ncbi:nuclear transport factor 2 family protein [Dermacoccaceae bacterium W4C1]
MNPQELATAYFDRWGRGAVQEITDLLAPEVTFSGPLAQLSGAQDCVQGLAGLASITERIDVRAMHGDEHEVITWFELHTTQAPPLTTANRMQVAGGKIVAIEVTFDPRPLLGARD